MYLLHLIHQTFLPFTTFPIYLNWSISDNRPPEDVLLLVVRDARSTFVTN